jgi:hypothetical protein
MLARTTIEVLRGLPDFGDDTPQDIARAIEDLVAYGDLLELPVEEDGIRQRRLYLGPPAYVRREGTNSALLVGVRSEGAPLLSDELAHLIEYHGHARIFRTPASDSIDLLQNEGLSIFQPEQWLRAPRRIPSEDLLGTYTSRLESRGLPGDVELRLIDPKSSPRYYRGRWRGPKSADEGLFIARRPQAFGADLWCLVELTAGRVAKLLDMPIEDPLAPAADEAWRLQAAMDALNGNPQRVRMKGDDGSCVLEFFAPVPSWAQRRLDVLGVPARPARGALFAYELPSGEVDEELEFLVSMLWIEREVTA